MAKEIKFKSKQQAPAAPGPLEQFFGGPVDQKVIGELLLKAQKDIENFSGLLAPGQAIQFILLNGKVITVTCSNRTLQVTQTQQKEEKK